MQHRVRLKLWNHWFWITTALGILLIKDVSCDSLMVDPQKTFYFKTLHQPILQSVNVNETDPNVVVSKSVSVSKVSVKMGDVTEEKPFQEVFENNVNNNYLSEVVSLPIVNPRVVQPADNFLQHLLDQLNQVSAVNVDNDALNYVADDDSDYQLMYKDEEYFSDYDLDHLSDEYLDYLYQIYDDMSNVLSLYDDITDDVVDDSAPVINILEENNNDYGEAFSRSKQAEGRSLDPEEEITEQLVDNIVAPIAEEVTADTVNNKLEYVDKFLNTSKEEVKEETMETTIEDFVVELKSTNNSDVYIKIAIFITVTLAVLIMTGGLIFVLMKRKKIKTVSETSLVNHQEESVNSFNNQVVFQKGLKTSTTTSLQEHFNNHFGKAAYLYDDLHSLDNDSFLTSLETISEKDKFDWD